MKAKVMAGVVIFLAALGLLPLGAGAAGASPATASAAYSQQVGQPATTTAAASSGLMKDCLVHAGTQRGCSYFNPDNNRFRVCDTYNDGRDTIGRVSLNGQLWYQVDTNGNENMCYPGNDLVVPAGPGDQVCIHTGVDGLGWTTAECRRL